MSSNKKNTSFSIIVLLIIVFCLGFLLGYNFDRVIGVVEDTTGVTLTVDDSSPSVSNSDTPIAATQEVPITADEYFCEYLGTQIPMFNGEDAWYELNNNVPYFTEDEITTEPFEYYSDLDNLGRCGVTFANICHEVMPPAGEKRGSISSVKPTGWQSTKYDSSLVNGGYLYNRCHLIGYQLSGENANKQNLITGTRYLNIDSMLVFEDLVDDYVDETDNHVLYRVTPVFVDDELVARGVVMEGLSVEDDGLGVSYCVFCYNTQPGIEIDYNTGNSWLSTDN